MSVEPINKALFLDRDGVINIDTGYVHKVEDFQFVEGIFELVRVAFSKDYLICVITNQAGIGRGHYSVEEFKILSHWMCAQFKENKSEITKVYYSPYHPIHGLGEYKKDDVSRKPNPGMLFQAERELDIDLSKSADLRSALRPIFFPGEKAIVDLKVREKGKKGPIG